MWSPAALPQEPFQSIKLNGEASSRVLSPGLDNPYHPLFCVCVVCALAAKQMIVAVIAFYGRIHRASSNVLRRNGPSPPGGFTRAVDHRLSRRTRLNANQMEGPAVPTHR